MQKIKTIYLLLNLVSLIELQAFKNLFKGCTVFNDENFDCSDYICLKQTFPIRDIKIKSGRVDSLIFRGIHGNLKVPDRQFFNLDITSISFASLGLLEISVEAFQNITYLQELKFDHIQKFLISKNAGEFRPLRWKLRRLELNRINHNDIPGYINLLKMLNTIRVLQMSSNNLTYIPDLHFMHHLEKLELPSNLIKNLHIYPLGTILGTINFHHNLTSGSLPKSLKDLEMPENLLTRINTKIFKNMSNLVKLDFSKNKIEKLENYAFDRENISKSYEHIILTENPIYRIEKYAFCSKIHKKPVKVRTLSIISDVEIISKKEVFNSCIFKFSEIKSLTVMFVKCDCYTHLLNGSQFQCDSTELCNKSFQPTIAQFDKKCAKEEFSCELPNIQSKPIETSSSSKKIIFYSNGEFIVIFTFTLYYYFELF